MLTLTKKTDYALIALAGLACCEPLGTNSRELANWYGIPLPVLRNVLKVLQHAGIVLSTRGASGGYRLGRAPGEISLSEVVEAVEGPWRLAACCDESGPGGSGVGARAHDSCALESTCPISGPIGRLHRGLRSFLDQISIEDVITDRLPESIRLDGGGSKVVRATLNGEENRMTSAPLRRTKQEQ